jgi:hypothetical protein
LRTADIVYRSVNLFLFAGGRSLYILLFELRKLPV